jgi:Mg2+ and Co2+ transporter CorA
LFTQVVSHGEQVFPRVKERCASKSWFATGDITALEDLIGRLRRLKENLGFITSRVTTLQASLDSWQSEQINKSLYYLSFLSIVFLPLSIVTGSKFSLLLIIVHFLIMKLISCLWTV